MTTSQLTLAEGLRDGAMLSAAGLSWFTGSKIAAGAIAIAFASSLYSDWRKERDDNSLATETGEKDDSMASEEWQCPECGEWNFLYRVDEENAFCSHCGEKVQKDADVTTRQR